MDQDLSNLGQVRNGFQPWDINTLVISNLKCRPSNVIGGIAYFKAMVGNRYINCIHLENNQICIWIFSTFFHHTSLTETSKTELIISVEKNPFNNE